MIPYLARRKMSFGKKVQDFLDASEVDLRELAKEPKEVHTLDMEGNNR